jgi:hypothetical protein
MDRELEHDRERHHTEGAGCHRQQAPGRGIPALEPFLPGFEIAREPIGEPRASAGIEARVMRVPALRAPPRGKARFFLKSRL